MSSPDEIPSVASRFIQNNSQSLLILQSLQILPPNPSNPCLSIKLQPYWPFFLKYVEISPIGGLGLWWSLFLECLSPWLPPFSPIRLSSGGTVSDRPHLLSLSRENPGVPTLTATSPSDSFVAPFTVVRYRICLLIDCLFLLLKCEILESKGLPRTWLAFNLRCLFQVLS